jgi:hypothetical protein
MEGCTWVSWINEQHHETGITVGFSMPTRRSTPIDESQLHVYPCDDLREHVIDPDVECWCKPTMTEDGILVHNSLDRRELYETDDGRMLRH